MVTRQFVNNNNRTPNTALHTDTDIVTYTRYLYTFVATALWLYIEKRMFRVQFNLEFESNQFDELKYEKKMKKLEQTDKNSPPKCRK